MKTVQPDLFDSLEFNLCGQQMTDLPAPMVKEQSEPLLEVAPSFAPTKQDRKNAMVRSGRYNISLKYDLVEEAEEQPHCGQVNQVADYMRDAFDSNPEVESFWVLVLDRKNRCKGRQMVTLGTANNSLVHPREVYRAAIIMSASAIVCVHNHPSGDPTPSAADIQVTRQLREAAKTVGIDMVDHVIMGRKDRDPSGVGYYSFRGAGLV